MFDFITLKLHTTGLENPSIVSSAISGFHRGNMDWRHDYVCRPMHPIEAGATAIHGITNEFASEFGITHERVVSLTAGYVYTAIQAGTPVVVWNAPFDLTTLAVESKYYGVDVPSQYSRIIDPYVIARHFKGGNGAITSAQLGHEYGYPEFSTTLGAAEYGYFLGKVLYAMIEMYPNMLEDPDDIHAYCARWDREWKRKKNYPSGNWPIFPEGT